MRHRKKLKKLGLRKSHRESLLKNLIGSLVIEEHLKTTESRAKALAARFGHLMNILQKKEKREAIRILPGYCNVAAAQRKLVDTLIKRYDKRSSGFTRITRVGLRKGDSATLVQIELI